MMWNYGSYFWWGGLHSIISLLIGILVIILIVKIISRLAKKDGFGNWSSWSNSAETLLKERFVKGEISKEEYEEKLKILRS